MAFADVRLLERLEDPQRQSLGLVTGVVVGVQRRALLGVPLLGPRDVDAHPAHEGAGRVDPFTHRRARGRVDHVVEELDAGLLHRVLLLGRGELTSTGGDDDRAHAVVILDDQVVPRNAHAGVVTGGPGGEELLKRAVVTTAHDHAEA